MEIKTTEEMDSIDTPQKTHEHEAIDPGISHL